MFEKAWKIKQRVNELAAVGKGCWISLFHRNIAVGNYAHGLTLLGYSRFTFGKGNRFNGTTFDARNSRTKSISIGDRNHFGTGVLVTGDGGDIQIGDDNKFSSNVTLSGQSGYLKIGNRIFIGPGSVVQGCGGLEIGDGAMIAAHCFLSSSNHDISNPFSAEYLLYEIGEKVTIGKKAWLGAGVVVTAGVNIGDFSVIGAGSVVTRDVPPYSIAVGSPAKVVSRFDQATGKWQKVTAS